MKTIPTRQTLEDAYRQEKYDTGARILLALKVVHDNMKPARASRQLNRSRPWATKWLRRFRKRGLEGLRDADRAGRPPKLDPSKATVLKRKTRSSKSGWTVTEVREVIRKEGGAIYSKRQVYRLLHRWDMRGLSCQRQGLHPRHQERRGLP